MIKALLKKQIWALRAFFTVGKNGKRRSVGTIIGFAALLLYGLGGTAVLFWMLAAQLCAPLVAAGFGWVYFAFIATIATGFGIIGGVFMAKTQLYEAKDNDFLLSMPIPTWAILFSRIIGLYLLTFAFETLVFAPAVIKYYTVAGVSVAALLGGVLVLLVMPLGAMALCCFLGFVLAWITAKFPLKNLLTVLGFAGFIVIYIVLNSKMQEYLTYVMMHGEAVVAVLVGDALGGFGIGAVEPFQIPVDIGIGIALYNVNQAYITGEISYTVDLIVKLQCGRLAGIFVFGAHIKNLNILGEKYFFYSGRKRRPCKQKKGKSRGALTEIKEIAK
jgi:ABC-2 type transport system permease protein